MSTAPSTRHRKQKKAKLLLLAVVGGTLALGSEVAPAQTAQPAPEASQQPASTLGATDAQTPAKQPDAAVQSRGQQTSQTGSGAVLIRQEIAQARPALSTDIWSQSGKPVSKIVFQGVVFSESDPMFTQLKQRSGTALNPESVREDLRRLFASGYYRDIAVRGEAGPNGLELVYVGVPRFFVGRVHIAGVQEERLAGLLEFATKLDPGTAYTSSDLPAAVEGIRASLATNGYFAPVIIPETRPDTAAEQINFVFHVATGPQARIGAVDLLGKDTGFSVPQFRKVAKLNCGFLASHLIKNCNPKVNDETVSNALSGARDAYQKQDRLEGTISLQKQTYAPVRKQLDYQFQAERGPLVNVMVEGAKISKSRLHLLVPIYQESAVDNDLLNEGSFNIHDYFQRKGYFDVQTSVSLKGQETPHVTVDYKVDLGREHRVVAVDIKGNKYFDHDTLQERLQVKKGDLYQRAGVYSGQLVSSDVSSIQALYLANGFADVKVTSSVADHDTGPGGQPLKTATIAVTYKIEEGLQKKFGAVTLDGVASSREETIHGLVQTEQGQPFSLITLSGDRDLVLNWYLAHGFEDARVEIKQKPEQGVDASDITFAVAEGHQVFVNRVLISGDNHTRKSLVESQLLVHAGDPLDQAALLDTQRNLYNLALFNEANVAVQNPAGNASEKNVLVQLTEAKRWDVTYGFGFEAQTGTPAVVPGEVRGSTAAQNGKAGVSPRVSLDVSRINLRGTQQSLTLHATYGLLERIATLTYTVPEIFNRPNLSASISGGYSNVQNISTFQSSTLQGDFRIIQKYKRADTFIYDFQYRRVSVDASSLEISPNLIPQLSEPVTVGGPAFTWFHDTRDPSPLDATRGQYISIQEFLADSIFGSDTNFNRFDGSEATYYSFGKKKYVLARNTRIGFENLFGNNSNTPIVAGTTSNCNTSGMYNVGNVDPATCNPIPLPERLYAGGATSHRGFGINDAGPRDLITGYPVGGSAVVINTVELRLPPPTLPYVGDSVSFVIFHDMGNVFLHPGDMFTSIKNFRQPDEQTCSQVLPKGTPIDVLETTVGKCNFNYYSHAVGLGLRYKTPVGPIRLDFSYNLNPPKYPVNYDYTNNSPFAGQASHFNFFFSIGQAF